MEYLYTILSKESITSIKQLRQVFATAFTEDSIWNKKSPSDAYLEKVLADTNYIALVAKKENGEVVGGLVGYILPQIDRERNEVYLYDLAVSSEYHRQGIATQLITELKGIAKTYGADTIFVQADHEDGAAVALYTKLSGQKKTTVTHFDIRVS